MTLEQKIDRMLKNQKEILSLLRPVQEKPDKASIKQKLIKKHSNKV